jgi:hypothetical protein
MCRPTRTYTSRRQSLVSPASAETALGTSLLDSSQPSESVHAGDTGPTLRVETTLVQIPVAVTDSVNRFVLGLQKQDFHLLEDGVEQDIAHFSGEEAPLSGPGF